MSRRQGKFSKYERNELEGQLSKLRNENSKLKKDNKKLRDTIELLKKLRGKREEDKERHRIICRDCKMTGRCTDNELSNLTKVICPVCSGNNWDKL